MIGFHKCVSLGHTITKQKCQGHQKVYHFGWFVRIEISAQIFPGQKEIKLDIIADGGNP